MFVTALLTLRDCPACAGERAFEQPPCADGHEVDCPELICVDCGLVLVVGPVLDGSLEPAVTPVAA